MISFRTNKALLTFLLALAGFGMGEVGAMKMGGLAEIKPHETLPLKLTKVYADDFLKEINKLKGAMKLKSQWPNIKFSIKTSANKLVGFVQFNAQGKFQGEVLKGATIIGTDTYTADIDGVWRYLKALCINAAIPIPPDDAPAPQTIQQLGTPPDTQPDDAPAPSTTQQLGTPPDTPSRVFVEPGDATSVTPFKPEGNPGGPGTIVKRVINAQQKYGGLPPKTVEKHLGRLEINPDLKALENSWFADSYTQGFTKTPITCIENLEDSIVVGKKEGAVGKEIYTGLHKAKKSVFLNKAEFFTAFARLAAIEISWFISRKNNVSNKTVLLFSILSDMCRIFNDVSAFGNQYNRGDGVERSILDFSTTFFVLADLCNAAVKTKNLISKQIPQNKLILNPMIGFKYAPKLEKIIKLTKSFCLVAPQIEGVLALLRSTTKLGLLQSSKVAKVCTLFICMTRVAQYYVETADSEYKILKAVPYVMLATTCLALIGDGVCILKSEKQSNPEEQISKVLFQ